MANIFIKLFICCEHAGVYPQIPAFSDVVFRCRLFEFGFDTGFSPLFSAQLKR